MILLVSCQAAKPVPDLASEISIYNWSQDLPQDILDNFEKEYKVKVNYLTYSSQEEALEEIRHGKDVDLVVFDSRFVPLLIQEGLLAQLSYENIPNFRFISPSFRDLVYDSGNRYSIPYSWGTIGLVSRTDLAEMEFNSWSDFWNPVNENKIAVWRTKPRVVIGLALKSIGYSANTENQDELEAASKKLMDLRPGIIFYEDYDSSTISAAFMSGDIVAGAGYSSDFLSARKDIDALKYSFPEEGALLWGDTFVIPLSSKEKYSAEVFLNYLLKPEISAAIVNFNHYATANLLAYGKVLREILNEPAIFPPQESLKKVESISPISKEAQEKYDKIWGKFLAGIP